MYLFVSNNKGILIIFSGPSGVGKDSIIKEILKKRPNFELSISCTTRAPRTGEVHGKDYYFLSVKEFQNMIDNDEMLEYAIYCDNFYGTPKTKIENDINNGKVVILEIEVNGAEKIMKKCLGAVSIFVLPPSMEELGNRLIVRGTDEKNIILKRIKEAEKEIQKAHIYDYVIVNNNIDKCFDDIIKIIDSESRRVLQNRNTIERVLLSGRNNKL